MRWAIVIGIDDYREQQPTLLSAVEDAEAFRSWVLGELGGDNPDERVYTLLGRRADDSDRIEGERLPTKDNVLGAINELMTKSRGGGQKLFFFFSGHGLTSTYSNREESALVFPGVDDKHPVQTLAVRSIAEFFETTQFQDQFFFIDACRSPLERSNAEIGPWMIPRRRAPGQEPVQQFVMYATSPGQPAKASLWPEELSAFSRVLMSGLEGKGDAKAWSWERNSYEVRWERLATHVKTVMEGKRTTERVEERQPPEGGWPFQIPQDIGIRGVALRDRDAILARPRGEAIERHKLKIQLNTEPEERVDVAVLDAVSTEVASARNLTGDSYTFELQPKTYSVRATTAAGGRGRVRAPVHLYGDFDDTLDWDEYADPEPVDQFADGTIEIRARDPLAVADIRDDTGWVVGAATQARGCEAPPGFYQVRLVGPERDKTAANDEPVKRPGRHGNAGRVGVADSGRARSRARSGVGRRRRGRARHPGGRRRAGGVGAAVHRRRSGDGRCAARRPSGAHTSEDRAAGRGRRRTQRRRARGRREKRSRLALRPQGPDLAIGIDRAGGAALARVAGRGHRCDRRSGQGATTPLALDRGS